MARSFIGILILAAVIIAPGSVWAAGKKTDSDIARAIVTALKEKAGELAGFQIGVRVDRGDVWIEGTVPTREQQALVLDVARRIPGVMQVVNDTTVISPEKTPPKKTPPVCEPPEKKEPSSVIAAAANVPFPYAPQSHQRSTPIPYGRNADSNSPSPWKVSKTADQAAAERIMQAIRSKNEAGELKGFDIVVSQEFGMCILRGRVAHVQTRDSLVNTVRGLTDVPQAWDHLAVADECEELSDKVTPVSNYPAYPNYPTVGSRQILDWDDGWWQLDFKSKKHD